LDSGELKKQLFDLSLLNNATYTIDCHDPADHTGR
jgi:hypothetical protein